MGSEMCIRDRANSDVITERSFWVGVYPGLTDEMIDYVVDSFGQFLRLRAAA